MVGVAGKSKACNNCKRRRVKCGFERPGCLRCSKARIQCLGYDRSANKIFVNKTLADPSVSATTVLAKNNPGRLQHPVNSANGSESDKLGTLAHLITLSNSPTTAPRDFRHQTFQLVQKLYLPQPEVIGEDLSANTIPNTWFGAVCDLDGECPVLDHALITFCAIQMHVTNTENVSREQAIEHYNVTLGQLSAALNSHVGVKMNYILASLVVLSIFEIYCFPTDEGLSVHIQGLSDIMRLQRCTEVPATSTKLWSRLRVISVLSQLTGGPLSSVTAAKWLSITTIHGQRRDPIDLLMDIVYELPSIFNSTADVLRKTAFPNSDLSMIINALWHKLRDIYSWHAILLTNSTIPAYTLVPSRAHNIADEGYDAKLFPYALDFTSFETAILLVSSWAFQIQILIHLERLSQVCDETPPQFAFLRETMGDFHKQGTKLAHLLCQSFEYAHRVEMGTFGFQIYTYPGWVLKQFFEIAGMERELRWCHHVDDMTGPGIRAGIRLMKFQGSIGV